MKYRFNVIKELIKTESDYVRDINLIIEKVNINQTIYIVYLPYHGVKYFKRIRSSWSLHEHTSNSGV
jgi:hypothetical protein